MQEKQNEKFKFYYLQYQNKYSSVDVNNCLKLFINSLKVTVHLAQSLGFGLLRRKQ